MVKRAKDPLEKKGAKKPKPGPKKSKTGTKKGNAVPLVIIFVSHNCIDSRVALTRFINNRCWKQSKSKPS